MSECSGLLIELEVAAVKACYAFEQVPGRRRNEVAVLLEKAILYQTLDRSVDVNRCQSDSIAYLLLRQRLPKWLTFC